VPTDDPVVAIERGPGFLGVGDAIPDHIFIRPVFWNQRDEGGLPVVVLPVPPAESRQVLLAPPLAAVVVAGNGSPERERRRSTAAGGNGTIRSSGPGGRPIIAGQPPSFHSASIAASVGWTGTWRTVSVFVDFSRCSRVW
jgi:hypothetical protein